jgi:hypothetical protein
VVHHVDGNRRNNVRTNLVICQDAAYHKLLHYRAKILRLGGNPNTDRYCSDCRTLKPIEDFNRLASNKCSGRQTICRECSHRRFARWVA